VNKRLCVFNCHRTRLPSQSAKVIFSHEFHHRHFVMHITKCVSSSKLATIDRETKARGACESDKCVGWWCTEKIKSRKNRIWRDLNQLRDWRVYSTSPITIRVDFERLNVFSTSSPPILWPDKPSISQKKSSE
jgi:hypothetical protein